MRKDNKGNAGIIIIVIITIIGILFLLFAGIPVYRVWTAEKSGEALKMKATQERQVIIEQARAEKESALLRAEAIQIIGQAAKDFPEYRTQEFIGAFAEALREGTIGQIIYVPTEANIPILEAGKR